MFDARLRPLIDPPLDRIAGRLHRAGISADAVTVAGFALGAGAALAIVFGQFLIAFALIAANRLADGLDGALARCVGATDRGGYLDIVLDFAFYGLVPLAFAVHDPPANALAAGALLTAFYINGAAFLAFAIMAQKRGLTSEAQGKKSLFYVAGLAEGAETVAVFLVMTALPGWFAALACAFAALTALSAAARIVAGATALR
ncbi:CDP-alcohol phosphatidyltransferase family protein [Methylobrevis pamukkalensis]|uniref:Inner membrane protein YnjF n=1 Tax=Methylobrevis pamukkalensis TaxID=1439726 RepID=A0A1E3H2D5_9HYPH|nr:CDP-alcohol phosphatidyltransferase family protein [Methylobrevis pamukkalensis]ODN70488.1 Inner membrane protein YnjF [Methylobrevis pamukkalensis]